MLTLGQLAYYNLGGLPLLIYFGIVSLLLLITTGLFGFLVLKGKVKFSWHKWFAIAAITIAVIHAILVISSRL
jgi:hypothetical protein